MIASILWDVDPVWFKVGSWEVRWYGLMWGLGFILAYEMVGRLFKKEKYPEDWVDKLFVYCIVSTVIGARLGHCLFYEWDYYSVHPAEILKIWKGGLAMSVFRPTVSPVGTAVPASYDPQTVQNISQHTG